MELKNIISQTLNEINQVRNETKPALKAAPSKPPTPKLLQEEKQFLIDLEQKTLLLFEGLKSPQTKNISMKLDLVINYLQYQLYMIEERLKAYED
ncbi:CiaD-like domain-containing protein [Helicobacter suis]|uniref:CiaD-like domain-containing protein n=1 Tax=Helicobacter suis TaxID=104628 RepID=UPI0013D27AB8|nr:hypothetical protein [Helicobacter suis]